MLDENRAEYTRDRTRGVPRAGAALLQGIAYCGESGHKLTVVYRPRAQYRCVERRRRYGGPLCQTIPADPGDARVVAAFFAALRPAELARYDRALREQRAAAARVARAHAQQLERLRYEAALAERQFRRVDPDNRLVAAELERRWEQALRDVRQAEADLAARAQRAPPFVLSAALRAALTDLGAHLPALWASGALAREHQKALLRCLIDKVVLPRPVHDRIRTRIVWRGGDTTTVDVPVPVGAFAKLAAAADLEREILAQLAAGGTDDAIAEGLTRRGYRSPRRAVVIASTVRTLRLKHRILLARPATDPRRPAGYLTVAQVAAHLGVAEHWVYARSYRRQIQVARDPATTLYLVPDRPDALALLAQLKAGTAQTVRLYEEHHHA